MNQRTHSLLQDKAKEQDKAPDQKTLLNQLKLSELDEVSKKSAPPIVSLAIYGTTFFLTFGSCLYMVSNGYFTPAHTNSFGMISSTIAQVLMVVGCGGLTGLRYVNFSVLPSVSKQMSQQSATHQWLTGAVTSCIFPFGCMIASLTMIDSMSLYGMIPALLGFGSLAICTYLRA